MKIVLFGAGGHIGQRIAHEALERGHELTGVVRDTANTRSDTDGLKLMAGDATDASSVERAARGADVIVSALSPRPSPAGRPASSLVSAARALLEGAKRAGVKRLVVVGGAGSLEVAPGVRLVDAPGFPEEYKPESLDQAAALDVYRTSDGAVDWTYISPAAEIGPGMRRGKYRRGDDSLMKDDSGKSFISYDDYAMALVDEIEHPTHSHARMAVAY